MTTTRLPEDLAAIELSIRHMLDGVDGYVTSIAASAREARAYAKMFAAGEKHWSDVAEQGEELVRTAENLRALLPRQLAAIRQRERLLLEQLADAQGRLL